MPFWALYILSDILYWVIYKILGYRKQVVYTNLKNSFPEKTDTEIKILANKFYRNLCDVVVESVKMISMSKAQILERNQFPQHKVVDDLNAQGRTCFYFAGHLGNWEWSPCVAGIASQVTLWGVYSTLKDKAFDGMTKAYRSRFGCEMIPMEQIARRVLLDKQTKNICFIADQTPANPDANIWVDFMHQQTLAFSASAKLARKINAAIIYASIIRVKRGHYEYLFDILVENPKEMDEQTIMQTFFTRLEQDIHEKPDMWLWSHKRWKHKRETITV